MDDKYIFHLVIQNKFDIETIADTIAKLIEKKMDKEDILNRAYKYYINKATPQERSNYEEVLGSLLWEQLKQHNYKFSKAKKYIAENILTNHIVEKLKDIYIETDSDWEMIDEYLNDILKKYINNFSDEERIKLTGSAEKVKYIEEIITAINNLHKKEIIKIMLHFNLDTKKVTSYLRKMNYPENYKECYEIIKTYCKDSNIKREELININQAFKKKKQQEQTEKNLSREVYEYLKNDNNINNASIALKLPMIKILELYYKYNWNLISQKNSCFETKRSYFIFKYYR